MIDNNDDLTDPSENALPPVIDELAVPLPLTQLQPWHRPRKQVIREEQWVRRSRALIQRYIESEPNGVRQIKYLTLPGIDYLDVRLLADVCNANGFELVSTGFLAAEEGNPVRARAQMREEALKQARYIADHSTTLPTRLEEISNVRSQAHIDLKRRGSFDIVNIDACGSIALPAANHANRLLDAIHKLVDMQFNLRRRRWLMFLTTDARVNTISPQLKTAFVNAVMQNAAHSVEFAEEARSLFQAYNVPELKDALDLAANDEEVFIRFFSLGYSKYLLLNSEGVSWDVKVHDCYCYSTTPVGNETTTMASLAFEFIPRPIPLVDQFGAVGNNVQAPQPAENYSLRALRKSVSMQDLDSRIAADAGLRMSMAERTAQLLKEAGYQDAILDGYAAFAES